MPAKGKTDESWELHYWPLAGRGEFVRLVFEEAGVAYKDISEDIIQNIVEGGMDLYPAYAPPVVRKGDFSLAQTPVICKYLGKEFGLFPDEKEDIWHAEQVNATIHDYIGEGRIVFHGKGFVMSYYQQKEETKPYIEWFIKERIDKWLNHFEKILTKNDEGKGYVVGEKITYVDLGLFHVLRATESQFREKWESMDNIPKLKAFKHRIEARPRINDYLKSSRCKPFEGNSMM